jgi:hypothetical protein
VSVLTRKRKLHTTRLQFQGLWDLLSKISMLFGNVPLIVLALICFHAVLFSVIAPHRLGIRKDETYRLQSRRIRIGVPLLVVTAGIGIGFGISTALS